MSQSNQAAVAAYVQRVVSEAPPLSPRQRERIQGILSARRFEVSQPVAVRIQR